MDYLTYWKSILLGALQGATEFLPISSSGHLVIGQHFLGLQVGGESLLAFDLALHLATLLAVIIYYRADLWKMASSLIGQGANPAQRNLFFLLIVGSLPAALVGFSLKDVFEQMFEGPYVAAFFLFLTGLILWSTRFALKNIKQKTQISWKDSLCIGALQALAICPGISRSGATIAAGLWLGIKPVEAARFSFLLAIPAILGASLLKAQAFLSFPNEVLAQLLSGMLVAFLVGYLSIWWLLRLLGKGQFAFFAIYCWLLGGSVLVSYAF